MSIQPVCRQHGGANTGRLVVLRTGIVLDNDTPALDRLRSRPGCSYTSAPGSFAPTRRSP